MKRRILIVDDEIHLARIIDFTLRAAGYETTIAHDGPEAIEAALSSPPDLVVLDLTLPRLGGEEVCRRLRAGERTRAVPVIILTAYDVSRRTANAVSGPNLWMEKPFEAKVLLARIAELIAGSNNPATPAE